MKFSQANILATLTLYLHVSKQIIKLKKKLYCIKRANSIDPYEAVHYQPPQLDLHCLQSQQFSLILILAFSPES